MATISCCAVEGRTNMYKMYNSAAIHRVVNIFSLSRVFCGHIVSGGGPMFWCQGLAPVLTPCVCSPVCVCMSVHARVSVYVCECRCECVCDCGGGGCVYLCVHSCLNIYTNVLVGVGGGRVSKHDLY